MRAGSLTIRLDSGGNDSELSASPGGLDASPPNGLAVPLRPRHGDPELAFLSTGTTFGSALDLTAAQLRGVPARRHLHRPDRPSARRCRELKIPLTERRPVNSWRRARPSCRGGGCPARSTVSISASVTAALAGSSSNTAGSSRSRSRAVPAGSGDGLARSSRGAGRVPVADRSAGRLLGVLACGVGVWGWRAEGGGVTVGDWLRGQVGGFDAVPTEPAHRLLLLAPGDQIPLVVGVGDQVRLDPASGRPVLPVPVGEGEDPVGCQALLDGVADPR